MTPAQYTALKADIAANTKAMSELVKAMNRPREATAFQQRILDELSKE